MGVKQTFLCAEHASFPQGLEFLGPLNSSVIINIHICVYLNVHINVRILVHSNVRLKGWLE